MTVSQEKGKEQPLNIESIIWNGLTWVNIEQPTERETKYLAEHYPFHPLDLDDCLSRKQRPKIDIYPDYLFLIFHFSVYDKLTQISTHEQVSVFIGKDYLITLHGGQLKPLSKLFRECQTDEKARQENLCYGSGYLLYRILDQAVDAYFPILDKILSLLEDTEDSVFDENVQASKEVAILRRDIITQRLIMFPNRTTIAELEGKLPPFATVDMSVYFGDLMDHLNKICETLNECEEVIEVFKDTDYILSTDRTNKILALLTILATFSLPAVVLGTLYGMNINLPGGLAMGAWNFFGSYTTLIIVLILSVVPAGLMFWVFRRWRWI